MKKPQQNAPPAKAAPQVAGFKRRRNASGELLKRTLREPHWKGWSDG